MVSFCHQGMAIFFDWALKSNFPDVFRRTIEMLNYPENWFSEHKNAIIKSKSGFVPVGVVFVVEYIVSAITCLPDAEYASAV